MIHNSYIITGPTASGKSDFAHALAKRVGGLIINCDSVQVYRGIENLSASPLADPAIINDNIPYRLYSITDPTAPLSAGIWAKLARAEYDAARAAGKIPIFVGGAGFYLRALTTGLSDIPNVSDKSRIAAREMPNGYQFLQEHDPEWAKKIQPNDKQRVSRGIEVFIETGKPLSYWQSRPPKPVLPEMPMRVLILPPKDIVRERIAARMPSLARAAESEIRAIMNLAPDLPVTRADGILEMTGYFRGEIGFDDAVEMWRKKIEHGNMKRQYTWFRTQFTADIIINQIPTDTNLNEILQ